ncbi:MAG TPA: hypothetical protein VIU82_25945 [Bosea sp. (in: a-proteobacteria)]
MMTIAEMFRAIGDTPVLVALLFVVGVPFILWVYRDVIKWVLFGKR